MRLTKQCAHGAECSGTFASDPALATFIPDEVLVCDACLLREFDLLGREVYNYADDPLGIVDLYRRTDVLKALRKATGR